ncbi:MAG: hypothetical protein FWD49_06260 [Firmicutes bacterium]|nr:hypothetical protein [Bacillota bacterium]
MFCLSLTANLIIKLLRACLMDFCLKAEAVSYHFPEVRKMVALLRSASENEDTKAYFQAICAKRLIQKKRYNLSG